MTTPPLQDGDVEHALKLWVHSQVGGDEIDAFTMKQKAEEIARDLGKVEFVATEGWLSRWKKRESIGIKQGEDLSDISLS